MGRLIKTEKVDVTCIFGCSFNTASCRVSYYDPVSRQRSSIDWHGKAGNDFP